MPPESSTTATPTARKGQLGDACTFGGATHLLESVQPPIGRDGELRRGRARLVTGRQVADEHCSVRSGELDPGAAPNAGPVERLPGVGESAKVGDRRDLGHGRRRQGRSTRPVIVRSDEQEPGDEAGHQADRDERDQTEQRAPARGGRRRVMRSSVVNRDIVWLAHRWNGIRCPRSAEDQALGGRINGAPRPSRAFAGTAALPVCGSTIVTFRSWFAKATASGPNPYSGPPVPGSSHRCSNWTWTVCTPCPRVTPSELAVLGGLVEVSRRGRDPPPVDGYVRACAA